MSGEQKLKDELEKAVWHRDCTSRVAKNLAKNVDSLKSENAAMKESLAELIPCAEWQLKSTIDYLNAFHETFETEPEKFKKRDQLADIIDRAKKLLDKQPQSESDKTE